MATTFRLRITNEQIDVLRARLLATHWPSYDSRDGWALGTSSDDAKRLAQYWATQFDFDSLQQRLAALPYECVVIDDAAVHLVHARSPHPQAVMETRAFRRLRRRGIHLREFAQRIA